MSRTPSKDSPALALSLTSACAVTAAAGWLAEPALLGPATLAVIVLMLAFGWKGSLSGGVLWGLVGIFALFSGLILAMVALEDPAGPPRLWLGLPAPSALLIYAVWPLGVLPSLLYAFYFRTVLPEDRLERFLSAHSKNRK